MKAQSDACASIVLAQASDCAFNNIILYLCHLKKSFDGQKKTPPPFF